jgi:outer membrane immunogenic protein
MHRVFLAGVAVAAMLAPAAAQAQNWNGTYFGAEIGGGFLDSGFSSPGFDIELKDSAFVGGVYLGHDWQNGRIVYGAVANFDWLGFDDSDEVFGGKTTNSFGYEQDWVAALRGRAGFLASDQVLVFGSAGIAASRVEAFSASSGFFGDFVETNKKTLVGAAVGGGVEYRLAPNWSLKGEYTHYFFNDFKVGGVNVPPVTFSPSVGVATIGISYRF